MPDSSALAQIPPIDAALQQAQIQSALLQQIATLSFMLIAEIAIGILLYVLLKEYFSHRHMLLQKRVEMEALLQSLAHGAAPPAQWEKLFDSTPERVPSKPWIPRKRDEPQPIEPDESRLPVVRLRLVLPPWAVQAFTRVIATDVSRDQQGQVSGFAAVEIGAILAGQAPLMLPGVHVPESMAGNDHRMQQARDFLKQYLSGAKYIAHNPRSDLSVLLDWLQMGSSDRQSALMQSMEDTHTLAQARIVRPAIQKWSLLTLCRSLGLHSPVKPHTALGDAVRTAQLAVLLLTGRRVRITPLRTKAYDMLEKADKISRNALPGARMPYLCYFVINYDNENSAVETTDDSDEAEDFVDAKMDDAKNG